MIGQSKIQKRVKEIRFNPSATRSSSVGLLSRASKNALVAKGMLKKI